MPLDGPKVPYHGLWVSLDGTRSTGVLIATGWSMGARGWSMGATGGWSMDAIGCAKKDPRWYMDCAQQESHDATRWFIWDGLWVL